MPNEVSKMPCCFFAVCVFVLTPLISMGMGYALFGMSGLFMGGLLGGSTALVSGLVVVFYGEDEDA